MAVRVHVSNFQSIGDAEIEIDGFTVVTGTNNTGKTALQRAIRGVFQNTSGTAFIREGQTTCEVTVDFGDHKVTWSKGTGKKDRPTYVIDGGEPLYPGQAVPEEVAALGVVPIQAGGQEVWPTIAPQFSGQIFLLDKPGSAVAEAVADVERVGQLNRALRNAESDRRTAAATLKVRVADLAGYEDQVARYEGLDDAVAGVTALEQAQVQVLRLAKAIQGLQVLRDRLIAAREAAAVLAPVEAFHVPEAAEVQKLQTELTELQKFQQRLQKARAEVTRHAGVDTLVMVVDEAPAKRLLEALKVLKGFQTSLKAAQTRVAEQQAASDQAEVEQAASQTEFDEALRELGCCPTCGIEVSP